MTIADVCKRCGLKASEIGDPLTKGSDGNWYCGRCYWAFLLGKFPDLLHDIKRLVDKACEEQP